MAMILNSEMVLFYTAATNDISLHLCSMSETKQVYKCCQSCGIPWDKAKGRGANTDGSESEMYCSYCYKDGAFVQPDWTAADMKAYAVKKLQQYGIPGMLADLLTKGIPKLERWKSANND